MLEDGQTRNGIPGVRSTAGLGGPCAGYSRGSVLNSPPPPTIPQAPCGFLNFQAIGRAAGAIARPQSLRDDTFAAKRASVLEDGQPAMVFRVFVLPPALEGLAQDTREVAS